MRPHVRLGPQRELTARVIEKNDMRIEPALQGSVARSVEGRDCCRPLCGQQTVRERELAKGSRQAIADLDLRCPGPAESCSWQFDHDGLVPTSHFTPHTLLNGWPHHIDFQGSKPSRWRLG